MILILLPIAAAAIAAFMFAGLIPAIFIGCVSAILGFFGLGMVQSKFDNEEKSEIFNFIDRSYIHTWKTLRILNEIFFIILPTIAAVIMAIVSLTCINPIAILVCWGLILWAWSLFAGKGAANADTCNSEILNTMMEGFAEKMAEMQTEIKDFINLDFIGTPTEKKKLKQMFDKYNRYISLMEKELRTFKFDDERTARKYRRAIRKYKDAKMEKEIQTLIA